MNTPLALTLPLAAVLLLLAVGPAAAAIGGWRGTVRRGSGLGLRTKGALTSDAAQALANKVAAPVYAGAAVVGLVVALLVLFLPMSVPLTLVVGVLGLAGVVALMVAAGSLGEKAARTVPVPAAKPGSTGGGCGGCACGTGGGCGGLTRNTDAAASQA